MADTNAKRWQSCARWPHRLGFQNDLTVDNHNSREQAQAVCNALVQAGLGGNRTDFPFETWVEELPVYNRSLITAKDGLLWRDGKAEATRT